MEGVCAGITLQELIVNVVLPSTMTSPGNLQMAKQELQTNADVSSKCRESVLRPMKSLSAYFPHSPKMQLEIK